MSETMRLILRAASLALLVGSVFCAQPLCLETTEELSVCPVIPSLPVPREVCARKLYISAQGDDGNSGTTIAAPWQTLQRLNSIDVEPGTCVYLRANDVFVGEVRFDAGDAGAADNRIVLGSYRNDGHYRATIQAEPGASGVTVWNTGGVTIQDLNIVGPGTASTGSDKAGITLINTRGDSVKLRGVTIKRVSASSFPSYGISIGASSAGFEDVSIRTSCIHSNRLAGVFSYHSVPTTTPPVYAHYNITLRRVHAYNNDGDASIDTHTGSGIMLSGVDRVLIIRSRAYWNGKNNNSGGGGPVGIWAYDCNDVTIRECWSFENSGGYTRKDGGGYDFDGGVTNSRMLDNCSRGNGGPGYMVWQYAGAGQPNVGNVIFNNTSIDDGQTAACSVLVGQESDATTSNTRVQLNRVVASYVGDGIHPAIFMMQGTRSAVVANNKFEVNADATLAVVDPSAEATFCANTYDATDGSFYVYVNGQSYFTLSEWKAASPTQEALQC